MKSWECSGCPVVSVCTFTAKGLDSVPGQGTKILKDMRCGKKKKKKKKASCPQKSRQLSFKHPPLQRSPFSHLCPSSCSWSEGCRQDQVITTEEYKKPPWEGASWGKKREESESEDLQTTSCKGIDSLFTQSQKSVFGFLSVCLWPLKVQ